MKKILIWGMLFIFHFTYAELFSQTDTIHESKTRIGIFVKDNYYLRSKKGIYEILQFCKEANVDTIFLRLYNNDQCWFNTDRFNSREFKRTKNLYHRDLLKFILARAREKNIDVFAWFITFSFHKSFLNSHLLVKQYGKSVLSKDQYGNFYDGECTNELRENFYQRENLCWLEPGDPDVVDYLKEIVRELTNRYPELKGILFDFVRYPSGVPFIPGSRYIKWSYSPGYGSMSIIRFEKEYGFDPTIENISMDYDQTGASMNRALSWDNWRRAQVTSFLKEVSPIIRQKNMSIGCSVFPYADRLYFHGFQNWRKWAEEDIVDFLILMNYSIDNELIHLISKQHITNYPGKIWIGLAAYLYKGNAKGFEQQLNTIIPLTPSGITFFVYDEIKDNPMLINTGRRK